MTGTVWAQLASGVLAEVNLETGDVMWPLHEVTVRHTLAEHAGQLLFVAYGPSSSDIRVMSLDPSTQTLTPLFTTTSGWLKMAAGPQWTATASVGGTGSVIVRERDGGSSSQVLGFSVTTDDEEGILVSGEQGLRRYRPDAGTSDVLVPGLNCAAMDFDPVDGVLVCGQANNEVTEVLGDLLTYRKTDAGYVAEDAYPQDGGDRFIHFRGVERTLEGNLLAVRQDCEVMAIGGSAPPGFADLCAGQMVDTAAGLWAAGQEGGLVLFDGTGATTHLGAARSSGGLTLDGDEWIIGGDNDVRRITSSVHQVLGLLAPSQVAKDADGRIWGVNYDGLHLLDPTMPETPMQELPFATWMVRDVAPFGEALALALGAQGLGIYDPDVDTDPMVVASQSVDLVAPCPDGSVIYVDDQDVVRSYDATAGEGMLAAATGPVASVYCDEDEVIVGLSAGGLEGHDRDGMPGWATWGGSLPDVVRAMSAAP